jgi:hypothetical protein
MGIVIIYQSIAEQLKSRCTKGNDLGAGLRVGQVQTATFEVDPLPSQGEHLVEPSSGEDQQPDGKNHDE